VPRRTRACACTGGDDARGRPRGSAALIAARFGRRAGWGILDQTASSLTNFALGVVVARQTTTEAFGAFAIAFVTYLLFLNVGRAVVANPLLIRYSNVPQERWFVGAGRGVVSALVVGLVGGGLCIIAGIVAGGSLGEALVAIGLVMPALLVQDAWRFVFFAARRGRDAFLNDGLRAALLIPGFGVASLIHSGSVIAPIVAWGLAAGVAALFGILQVRVRPERNAVQEWFGEHRDLIPRFVAESLANAGSGQLTYVLMGAVGGLSAVGAIRAGELVLGPYNILSMGVFLVVLPEARRLLNRSDAALVRGCVLLALGLTGSALAFGLLCLALPDPVGRLFLGESWDPGRSVLLPLVLALTGWMAAASGHTGLRALEAADRILRIALITSTASLLAATLGVWLAGAVGAAWGLAAGSWLGMVVSWIELRAAVRWRRP
jgi:O-antigen/teichoic acid export membrane protein